MAKKDSSDSVKAIFGKTASEMFAEKHEEFHSLNAFCDHAGPEEMQHYKRLMAELSNKEVVTLAVALDYVRNPAEGSDSSLMRQSWVNILTETDREDFYREYYKIIDSR